MKIGIVGQGYVGTAIKVVFEQYYKTDTFDLNGKCTCETINDLVDSSDIIFICVPTPMKKDGSCDISIVETVVRDINTIADNSDKIIAIKSTIPPGTTEKLNEECDDITVLFNPEFLTEANFIEDFKNQNRVIIGGLRRASAKLKQIYSLVFPNAKIVITEPRIAEMVKYFTNTFLATKVSFANEMKMICDGLNINYNEVMKYAIYDERLGRSHWAVPGPDSKLGFGGSCFPKDLNALIKTADELGVLTNVLNSVLRTNLEVRPEEDWKELKGRAISENND